MCLASRKLLVTSSKAASVASAEVPFRLVLDSCMTRKQGSGDGDCTRYFQEFSLSIFA